MRKQGFYERYTKRLLDIICSILVIVVFSWLFCVIAILVRIKIGSPVVFAQSRPGMVDKDGKERIFTMYKFRTMTDAKDKNGKLKSDEERLTSFGRRLRATSLDELPEVINILKGDMSVIGPRPQLVRDMVFMDEQTRIRHTVRPGLSGLAQVNGRNSITWDQKFKWDLKYVEKISFMTDLKIVLLTVRNVFIKGESSNELDVTDDYGDALLKAGKVSHKQYIKNQAEAKKILASIK